MSEQKKNIQWLWIFAVGWALVAILAASIVLYERSSISQQTIQVVDKWVESNVEGGSRTTSNTRTSHNYFISTPKSTFETSREIYGRLEKNNSYRVEVGGVHSKIVQPIILKIINKKSK